MILTIKKDLCVEHAGSFKIAKIKISKSLEPSFSFEKKK